MRHTLNTLLAARSGGPVSNLECITGTERQDWPSDILAELTYHYPPGDPTRTTILERPFYSYLQQKRVQPSREPLENKQLLTASKCRSTYTFLMLFRPTPSKLSNSITLNYKNTCRDVSTCRTLELPTRNTVLDCLISFHFIDIKQLELLYGYAEVLSQNHVPADGDPPSVYLTPRIYATAAQDRVAESMLESAPEAIKVLSLFDHLELDSPVDLSAFGDWLRSTY